MIYYLLSVRLWFYYPAKFGAIAYALWKGAGPERVIAITMILSFLFHRLFHNPNVDGSDLMSLNEFYLANDIGLGIAFIITALFANRMYTLWIAGFQIVALQAHLARYLMADISPLAYAFMTIGPMYLQIIALALGTWMHTRRVRRYGSYRSWRISSFPWPGKMRVG